MASPFENASKTIFILYPHSHINNILKKGFLEHSKAYCACPVQAEQYTFIHHLLNN